MYADKIKRYYCGAVRCGRGSTVLVFAKMDEDLQWGVMSFHPLPIAQITALRLQSILAGY